MARKQKNLNIGMFDKDDPELRWINSQNKAAQSIQFLINMAIKAYGEDTDIIKLFIQEGAKGNQLVSGIKPVGTTDEYFEPEYTEKEPPKEDDVSFVNKEVKQKKVEETRQNSTQPNSSKMKKKSSTKSASQKKKPTKAEPKKKERNNDSAKQNNNQRNDKQQEMLNRLNEIEG